MELKQEPVTQRRSGFEFLYLMAYQLLSVV